MPYRKISLAKNSLYHVFSRSIANYRIFNDNNDYDRFLETMKFYRDENTGVRFSEYLKRKIVDDESSLQNSSQEDKIVKIVSYCIMPTHIHIILKQMKENGVSKYLNLILKSYSKYFNNKYRRKGPLWEGRFKNILIENDEYLLHLTRYIHLNPVSSSLVFTPEDWPYSSYNEFLMDNLSLNDKNRICDFSEHLTFDIHSYRQFVEERIDYQKELEKIKHLIIE